MIEGVPSIMFSDRVKYWIGLVRVCRLTKTFIVKLLGGRIGFNSLLNKIKLLWNPQGLFQLMDLENDFYLVLFQEENDFNKVLTATSWVVFGRYLSIRPWSTDFSTSQSDFESQVV